MKMLIVSFKIFLFFTVLTGIFYPLLITGITQIVFPAKANGSLIRKGNQTIGSELIGQQFDSTVYFASRPSAISYNPLPSGGSNYALTNRKLKDLVDDRRKQFVKINGLDSLTVIPSEMVFASASGLDPHISLNAALLQVERIIKNRQFNEDKKQRLLQAIASTTEAPQFLFLGEQRVNVLLLNLKLNELE